jgi:ATP-dependent Clp protease adaptor protein ClpS
MSTKHESDVVTKSKQETKKPKLFKVLLHNDDYTTMEFVVSLLMSVFHHPQDRAFQIMLNVHKNGIGVAGVYTREVAETKVQKTTELARKYDFPLECTMEPE